MKKDFLNFIFPALLTGLVLFSGSSLYAQKLEAEEMASWIEKEQIRIQDSLLAKEAERLAKLESEELKKQQEIDKSKVQDNAPQVSAADIQAQQDKAKAEMLAKLVASQQKQAVKPKPSRKSSAS